MVKGVFETAAHEGWGYRSMGVHKVEEGSMGVGGGVEFGRVVITLFDDNVSFELEFGIGGAGGVLVRTVVRWSLRQVWRRGDEVEFEVIVDGEVWGAVRLILFVYKVMAVHGGGGDGCVLVTCVESGDPFGWLCTEIEMEIGGKEKKKREEGSA